MGYFVTRTEGFLSINSLISASHAAVVLMMLCISTIGTTHYLRRISHLIPQNNILNLHKMYRTLDSFGASEQTLQQYLKGEQVDKVLSGREIRPRQVKKVHYTPVLPEPVPAPYFIVGSRSCAESLELDPAELGTDRFVKAFSGNILLSALNKPYCTVYGCHCYGQWFGQLGDGRAIGIGEVYVENNDRAIGNTYSTETSIPVHHVSVGSGGISSISTVLTDNNNNIAPSLVPNTERQRLMKTYYGDHVFELQLKGAGRSPFSRGFDGRAVLRSSVREFLASEAMHHLGVPTTRALSVSPYRYISLTLRTL